MAKKRKKNGGKIVLTVVILAIVLGAGGFFFVQHSKGPVTLDTAVTVTIPQGASTTQIANALKEAGLIRNSQAFRSYAKSAGIDSKLKPGEYTFAAGNVDFDAIAEQLVKGKEAAGVKVTIPEGLTVLQTANLLAEKGLVDIDAFIEYTLQGDFPYDYLPPKGTEDRLEGFLFPNTYQIAEGWGEKEIVDMLLAQFDKTFTAEWRKQAETMDMTISEIVTMASIIEREGKIAEERPIIASVFYNRLGKDMLLQSCATVQYLLGEPKPRLTNQDISIDSPYNTYKNVGLPPGPIAAPGAESLEAALYPAETDYMYFCSKEDGTGSQAFAVTLAEHNANVAKYLD